MFFRFCITFSVCHRYFCYFLGFTCFVLPSSMFIPTSLVLSSRLFFTPSRPQLVPGVSGESSFLGELSNVVGSLR